MFGKKKRSASKNNKPEAQNQIADNSLRIRLANGSVIGVGNAQHQGRRPYQEDSCGYSDLSNEMLINSKGILAVLSDGMGGLSNGKEVSNATVQGMIEYFNNPQTDCSGALPLQRHAERINEAICNKFCSDGRINAGATLVCAMINAGMLHWLCIGDSRLYLKRNGMLYQVNEDHDYLNTLLDEAIADGTSLKEAFSDPQKDVLVSCIGNAKLPRTDVSLKGLELKSGDVIVLCSDGIYNAIPEEFIKNLLDADPQTAAQYIEEAVLRQNIKTQDNLTVIVISYD